jgi:hypothetical protein
MARIMMPSGNRSGDSMFPDPPPEPVAKHLLALEESLLQPDVRKSDELVALLADEFIRFGSSGRVYTKADLVDALQKETPSVQTTSHFQVWLLAPQAALLTYVIRRDGTPPVYTLRSSVWQQRDGHWIMVFHQATITDDPALFSQSQ